MTVKKVYRNIEIIFNILGETTTINEETVLLDICLSFNNIVCLDKNKPFNELVKLQQQNSHHLLVNNPKPFDEIRILIKMINNFLLITGQFTNLSIESISIILEDEIYAHSSEIFLGDMASITFSPSSRSHWTKPQLMNAILELR